MIKNLYPSAKVLIWKPVCIQACTIAGLIKHDEKDEKVKKEWCLKKLMLMPQEKLTEINKQLTGLELL